MHHLSFALKAVLRTALLGAAAISCGAAVWTQPQAVSGPCDVHTFFIVPEGTSNTTMSVSGGGQACVFTVIYAPFNRFQTAALITNLPSHGHADAGLIDGGTSAAVSYTPQPGYTGTDRFTATIEPGNKAVIVHVDVRAPGATPG